MYCHNCGNVDSFVLSVELASVVRPDSVADPRWSLSLSCHRCASTDVAGDPLAVMARR